MIRPFRLLPTTLVMALVSVMLDSSHLGHAQSDAEQNQSLALSTCSEGKGSSTVWPKSVRWKEREYELMQASIS